MVVVVMFGEYVVIKALLVVLGYYCCLHPRGDCTLALKMGKALPIIVVIRSGRIRGPKRCLFLCAPLPPVYLASCTALGEELPLFEKEGSVA